MVGVTGGKEISWWAVEGLWERKRMIIDVDGCVVLVYHLVGSVNVKFWQVALLKLPNLEFGRSRYC